MTEKELTVYVQQLRDFCDKHRVSKKKVPPRTAAVLTLKCTDHALRAGANIGLSFFFNSTPVAPLKPEEKRYYVAAADLPEKLRKPGLQRRAAVENTDTGERRLELLGMDGPRHRLHCRSDRGSMGWAQWFPLFALKPIMGSFWFDEPHKFWDTDRNAAAASGLGSLLAALLMCVNVGKAPYGSHSFQHQLDECAREYFSQASINDEWFLEWYERLRSGCNDPDPFGSEASLVRVLGHFKSCPFFQHGGDDVKWARWYSIVDKLDALQQWWWPYTCMLVLLCLQKGIYTNLQEVREASFKNYKTLKERVAEAGTGDGDGGQRRGGTSSRADQREVGSKLQKTVGKLHAVSATMAAEETLVLTRLIVGSLKPSRADHGRSTVMQKTRRGTQWCVADMACGGWQRWLYGLAAQLSKSSFLEEVSMAKPVASEAALNTEQETMLGHYAWQLHLSLLGHHLVWLSGFTWSFPMVAFWLVHADADVVQAGLNHVSRMWQAWQAAEEESHRNEDVQDICHNIVWMQWQWPRMLCLELDKH